MLSEQIPTTYPEMNAQIVSLLRLSDNPTAHYAAARIEELEAQVDLLQLLFERFLPWLDDTKRTLRGIAGEVKHYAQREMLSAIATGASTAAQVIREQRALTPASALASHDEQVAKRAKIAVLEEICRKLPEATQQAAREQLSALRGAESEDGG